MSVDSIAPSMRVCNFLSFVIASACGVCVRKRAARGDDDETRDRSIASGYARDDAHRDARDAKKESD